MTDGDYDLGGYARKVSTSTPDAQLWFDQPIEAPCSCRLKNPA